MTVHKTISSTTRASPSNVATAVAGAVLLLTGCMSGDEDPVTTPTAGAPVEDVPPADETPVPEDVDLDRDVQGESATPALIAFVEGMSLPDGAVTVINATMVRYKDVYYVVAALVDTPDGDQILTYVHAPWDQSDIGNGGTLEPLNEAAQQWAPMAPASSDIEARELGDRLIVGP